MLDVQAKNQMWKSSKRSNLSFAWSLLWSLPTWPMVVAPWHVFCVPLRCVGSSLPYTKSPHFLPFSFDCLMFLGIINHLIMANEVLAPYLHHKIESRPSLLGVVLIGVSPVWLPLIPPLPFLNWSSKCIFSNWSFWPKFGKPAHLPAIKENSISLLVRLSRKA